MLAQALKLPDPANEDAPGAEAAARAVREIAERFGKLSAEITDISGRVGDVNAELDRQTDGLHRVVASVEQVSRSNQAIQQAADTAQQAASVVKSGLERVTGAVRQGLNAAQNDIAELSDGAQSISQALNEAVGRAHKAREASEAIQTITREIQLLLINAGVEAARSGVAGRGFAVIRRQLVDLHMHVCDQQFGAGECLTGALVRVSIDRILKQLLELFLVPDQSREDLTENLQLFAHLRLRVAESRAGFHQPSDCARPASAPNGCGQRVNAMPIAPVP